MKTTLTYIGVIIALTAICFFAINSCNKRKVEVREKTFTEQQMDSVAQNLDQSSKIIDELIRRNNRVVIEKDSLRGVVDETGRKLEIQALKTTALTRESQLARTKLKDMESAGQELLDYVRSVDSLYPKIDSLVVLADSYRKESQGLQSSYDSLLSNNQFRIARAEFDRDFNKEKFDTLAQYTLALEKSKDKADKKAGKRFGVGPFIGATYISEKIKPVAGIGLTYSIIKF